MGVPRMTTQTFSLLAVLLSDPSAEWYGFGLADRANLKTGTLYPILARLESADWLRSHWEDVDPHVARRPRRRLYALTPHGEAAARRELADHLNRITPKDGRPALAPEVQPA
jgi:PadR family transcriptional regulator, regulatory protein PadR